MKKIFTLFAALTMVLSMFAATETVYFVNASSWTGTINAYAWTDGGANNHAWPGVAAAKEAQQIAGYDVYSYTAEASAYDKVIFNNGSDQTANLDWTAGKYYVVDGWYTKEEAEDKLGTPIPDSWTVAGGPESVFGSNWNTTDANNDMVKQANGTYKWEKTGLELVANSTISFKVVKNHAWGEAYPGSNYDLSIPEDGIYTITITFDPSTKSVNAVATKTSDAEVEVTISYVLMGVADDWTTGIALTANPDNANEYVLLGQAISEGDAVKVVTLTNGEKTAYCGNVDEYSVEHSADKDGNIVLAPGTYDFYYKVAENLIYIGAAEPESPTYTVTVSDNTGGFEPLTTGGGEYEEGENATVTASEEVEGWVFVGWMANEEFVANDPTYTFAVEGNTELVAVYAMVMEDEITNLVIDTDWNVLVGGPSTTWQVEVFLGLGEDDGEGEFLLSDESSVSIMGQDATWIDGKASVDMDAKTATAIVVVELGGTYYALSLTMSAPSAEPTNVVVVNAVATYDDNTGALTLTGIWKDAEVSVEIAGYDGKESVEYSGPQGIKFETPDVVAFGNEAEITVAGEDITVVCTASSFHSGDVFNVTITTLSAVGTALDNVTTTVAPAKAIVNGQLVIVKDGVKYNAQGTVVK